MLAVDAVDDDLAIQCRGRTVLQGFDVDAAPGHLGRLLVFGQKRGEPGRVALGLVDRASGGSHRPRGCAGPSRPRPAG